MVLYRSIEFAVIYKVHVHAFKKTKAVYYSLGFGWYCSFVMDVGRSFARVQQHSLPGIGPMRRMGDSGGHSMR